MVPIGQQIQIKGALPPSFDPFATEISLDPMKPVQQRARWLRRFQRQRGIDVIGTCPNRETGCLEQPTLTKNRFVALRDLRHGLPNCISKRQIA